MCPFLVFVGSSLGAVVCVLCVFMGVLCVCGSVSVCASCSALSPLLLCLESRTMGRGARWSEAQRQRFLCFLADGLTVPTAAKRAKLPLSTRDQKRAGPKSAGPKAAGRRDQERETKKMRKGQVPPSGFVLPEFGLGEASLMLFWAFSSNFPIHGKQSKKMRKGRVLPFGFRLKGFRLKEPVLTSF